MPDEAEAGDDRTAVLVALFEQHAVRLAGALKAAGYPDADDAVASTTTP
jgi:hypothetical protein